MAPKSSAFMVFTRKWKEKQALPMSIDDAVKKAGEIWKQMSAEEREPYVKQAALENELRQQGEEQQQNVATNRKKGCMKMACDGTPIIQIEREAIKKLLRKERMIKDIEMTIKKACEKDALAEQRFHFISVNYFERILNTDVYVPAEIAVIEFSLADGVRRKYHKFINPNTEIYGNLYEAKKHAETTHRLPLPPKAFGTKDLKRVFDEILDILRDESCDALQPLYASVDAIGYVTSALKYLIHKNDDKKSMEIMENLKIYAIQELFFHLKCATADIGGGNKKPNNRAVTDIILQRDSFEFTNNISCEYHEELDVGRYCALSKVIRYGYTFADYICKDLSINFIPGKHMPKDINLTAKALDKVAEEQAKDEFGGSFISQKNTYKSYNEVQPESFYTTVPNKSFDLSICSGADISNNPWKRNYDSMPPESHEFDINERRGQIVRGRGIYFANFNEQNIATKNDKCYKPLRLPKVQVEENCSDTQSEVSSINLNSLSTSNAKRNMGRGISILHDFKLSSEKFRSNLN